jgi:calcineurin-like phosphoesterase family protein
MINVGIMNNEYRPISIDDLIKKVEEKKWEIYIFT